MAAWPMARAPTWPIITRRWPRRCLYAPNWYGVDEIDILLVSAAPGPALATLDSTGDAAFASAWTLLGHPSLSLPLFRAADGLPLGCQVIGGATKDARLLSICKAVMARFAAT